MIVVGAGIQLRRSRTGHTSDFRLIRRSRPVDTGEPNIVGLFLLEKTTSNQMSVEKALLVELFAILLVLYGGFTVLEPDMMGETWALYIGFYLGLFGLIYGLVGVRIVEGFQNDT